MRITTLVLMLIAITNSILHAQEDPKEKLSYVLTALHNGEKELDTKDTTFAQLLYNVGETYLQIQELDSAVSFLNQAIEIQKIKAPNSEAYANSTQSLGLVHWRMGDYAKAEEYYLIAIDVNKKIYGEENLQYISCLNNLAVIYREVGRYKEAEPLYLKNINICKKIYGEEHPNYAKSLGNLGVLYKVMANYDQAEALYLEVLRIQKNALGEEHQDYATSLGNLGVLYETMGNYTQAEICYLQTSSIIKDIHDEQHPANIRNLVNLGSLYLVMNKYVKAEHYFQTALDISHQFLGEIHPYNISIMNNLGVVSKQLEDYDKAEYYYQQVLVLNKELFGDRSQYYAGALTNLATLYTKQEKYQAALEFLQQALTTYEELFGKEHPDYIQVMNNIGAIYHDIGKIEIAWQYVHEAIKLNSSITISPLDDSEVFDAFMDANYSSFTEMNKSLLLMYNLLSYQDGHAIKEQQAGVCNLALALLERYKNTLMDDSDKLLVLERHAHWITNYLQILDNETQAAEILTLAERSKSILLLESLGAREAYSLGLIPDTLAQKEKRLRKEYLTTQADLVTIHSKNEKDSIRRSLTNINLELDEFRTQLENDYPEYAQLKYQRQYITATILQQHLPAKTALLEYIINDTIIYLIYIDKMTIEVHPLAISQQELKRNVNVLHESLSNYERLKNDEKAVFQRYTETAYWFYTNTVAPSSIINKEIEHLIIIPDKELGYIPFETFLVEEAKENDSYGDLHYMIVDYTISYNYSATLWKENIEDRNQHNNGQILGIAANYSILLDTNALEMRLPSENNIRNHLNLLPMARKEVEVLSQYYDGLFALDSQASESLFKKEAANYSIIHLAMHGLLNNEEPMLSSLAFTENGDSSQNNFLQAHEITKMELYSDLVVLSACETGLGKFEYGNGVASLARSFMYAGASAIVVSLWEVNDVSSSKLMELFYQNLAEGMNKDEALRQAKLNYLKQARGLAAHPAYWSPFVMMGNTEAIVIDKKNSLQHYWWIGGGLLLVIVGLLFWRRRDS